MKTFLFSLFLCISFFTPLSSNAQSQKLKQYAETLNKDCPQKALDGMARMLGFSYDKNVFEASMEMNMGDLFDVTKISQKPVEAKELLGAWIADLSKTSFGVVFNEIIKANARYRIRISSMFVPDKIAVTYTSSEIKKLFAKYGKMTTADRILTMQVLSLNMQAPSVEDEYTTIDKLELTDESLIFYETMDDKLLGISALAKSELEVLKQEIIHGLSLSPVKDNVINACLKSFRTIKYIYTMKYSHNKYVIELKSGDLREILK